MKRFGHQLVTNILSSWGSYVGRILIAFFFIPYITLKLGETRYGVWVILFQIVNYLSLLDLGLERALTRYLSKYVASDDFSRVNGLIGVTSRIYLGLGLLVAAGAVTLSIFSLDYFGIESVELLADARSALIIIGLFLACRFWLLPIGGNLHSFQRADIANLFALIEELLRALLLAYLLYQGYGLTSLATGILGLSVVRQVGSALWLKRRYPQLSFSIKGGTEELKGKLFHYSRYSFGITLTSLILYGSDSVILGLLLSSAAAGIYAPAAQLLLYARQIVNAAATVITPAVSRLEQIADWDGIRDLYLMSLKFSLYLSVTAAVGITVFAHSFVDLWLEPGFQEAGKVMFVLSLGSLFFIAQIIGNSILYAIEKHRYLLYLTLAEAGLKLILSILLVKGYGLIGLAWGTTLPQLLFYAFIYPALMKRELALHSGQILGEMIRPILSGALILFPLATFLAYLFPADSWLTLVSDAILVLGVAAILVRLAINDRDRALYHNLNGQFLTPR